MCSKRVQSPAENVLLRIQPSKATPRKKAKQDDEEAKSSKKHSSSSKVYTPLLLAASTGIVEIVQKILELHPVAITHVSDDGHNILHVTVKHRQRKIYKLLKEYGALKTLAAGMSNKHRTLLHYAADMDYYEGGNQAGVVFQLQEELRWFERVRKIIPDAFVLYFDDKKKLTAGELFELEHSDMLKEAQDWIKGTAQSCSAVAVLVATVVFAAAYTIPGGVDKGIPILLHDPLFLFFTIMDVVALASSLLSVMMFLSILTSPFQMREFHKSLPRKLTIGFAMLFFSLMFTILAFGSTILITVRLKDKNWISSLIYGVTFCPVMLFGLNQFPIGMVVKCRVMRIWKMLYKIHKFIKLVVCIPNQTQKCVYSKYS